MTRPEPDFDAVDELANVLADAYLSGVRAGTWTLARFILAAGYTRVCGADGRHRYLSTGCLHGTDDGHAYCRTEARRYDGTVKTAATCKFCSAPCRCACHSATQADTERRTAEVQGQVAP